MAKKIYVICPVTNATEEEESLLINYVERLEREGNDVYYPARDTYQSEDIRIFQSNLKAIEQCDESHIFWNGKSSGSLVDLGKVYALGKPIFLINKEEVESSEEKFFTKILLELHNS